jgi:hypothetical protein
MTMLSNRLPLSLAVAFGVAVVSGVISQIGYEGVETMDDAFLGLALAFGAIFIGLLGYALSRVFPRPGRPIDVQR